jgi:hypothetical protein
MDTLTIFVTQLVLSIVVFSLIAKWFVGPWLADKPIHVALIALTFPHAMRHVGLSFLVPGLVADSLHGSFAGLAAYLPGNRRRGWSALHPAPRWSKGVSESDR